MTKANALTPPPDFYFFKDPRDKLKIIVRFCKNIRRGKIGFDYDEYEVAIKRTENVEEYIKNHYEELLSEASGGPSAIQKLYAYFDYISMMSGIDIPMEEGATDG
jgi:hypothetical protein